jgi:hypothetical protein
MHTLPTLVGLRTAPSAWRDRSYGVAQVTVLDEDGRPLAGAIVTGVFSGDLAGTRTAVTDPRGRALLQSGPRRRPQSFSFRLLAVEAPETRRGARGASTRAPRTLPSLALGEASWSREALATESARRESA